MKKTFPAAYLFCFLLITTQSLFAQTTVVLNPTKDNTLYQNGSGAWSNGLGDYLFAGTDNSFNFKRAVLAFPVSDSVPAGATILSASLTLNMNKAPTSNGRTVAMYRVTQDWGEGTSHAPGEEGGGTASTTGDATWIHTFYNTGLWTNPGGDFVSTYTDSISVGGNGNYTWSSAQLAADVQFFLDSSGKNYGWILIGMEIGYASVKRFSSGNNSNNKPALSITYQTPCTPPSISSLSIAEDTICTNTSTTLTVNGSLNDATAWYLYSGSCGGMFLDSSNTGTFSIDLDQSTELFVRGEGGCVIQSACDSTSIHVVEIDTGVIYFSFPTTAIAQQDSANYQWFGCTSGQFDSLISGANSQTYTVQHVQGHYGVIIEKDGCIDTSACISLQAWGIESRLPNGQLKVFPNPTAGKIWIPIQGSSDGLEVQVFESRGKSVDVRMRYSDTGLELDLPDVPNGIYWLRVNDGQSSISKTFLVKD